MKDAAFGIVPVWQGEGGSQQFLLIQHRKGHWGFPKGHAEPGETAIATACREFEEETGITAYRVLEQQSFSEHYWFRQEKRTIEKTVIYYPALVQSTIVTIQVKEIKDYCWLSYDDALTKLPFPQTRSLLTQVHQFLHTIEFTP